MSWGSVHSPTTETMTWREFEPTEDGSAVSVATYETPIGEPCDKRHSKLVDLAFVSRADAVRMLRTGVAS